MTACGNGFLIYGGFGGEHSNHFFSDTWYFEKDSSRWIKIFPDTASVNRPPRSASNSFTTISDISRKIEGSVDSVETSCVAILFGGVDRRNGVEDLHDNDETWKLEFQISRPLNNVSGTWSKVDVNSHPNARNEHVSISYDGSAYIHGGFTGNNADRKDFNDVWRFSITTGNWNKIRVSNLEPVARHSHAGTLATPEMSGGSVSAPSFIVYGGRHIVNARNNQWKMLDDVWILNLNSLEWTQLSPLSHGVERAYHSITFWSSKMVIFGGYNRIRGPNNRFTGYVYNDLYAFEVSSRKPSKPEELWTKYAGQNEDSAVYPS